MPLVLHIRRQSPSHPLRRQCQLCSGGRTGTIRCNCAISAQCRLQLWDVQTGAELLNSPSLCEAFTISPDGSTITSMSLYGESILVLGIPDSNRSAFMSVPVRVIPSTIAVRAKPSLDAEITGYLSKQREIVISGIDPSGKFYYMESYGGGWISTAAGYVDLGVFSTKDQIHVKEP